MGRYVPPEVEGTTSANKLQRKRAPGTLRQDGSQTVRFEMPFAVWCHHCKPHAIVGQGVRFNAEKKKVGDYYSTPIWSFRMKHVTCGGTLEIRTDPKNTAYVVVDGGKARDYGEPEDNVREGENGVPILTAEERERRRNDAFAQLEGRVDEKAAVKDNMKRIGELYRAQDRDWDDPWVANKKMRTTFRRERKVLKREEEATEALKARLGTDIDFVPEGAADAQRAKLVSYGDGDLETETNGAETKALFERRPSHHPALKSTKRAEETRKDALRRQLIGNTRAALNPFGAALR